MVQVGVPLDLMQPIGGAKVTEWLLI